VPATPAGDQARWLLQAVHHLPIPTSVVAAHFNSAFLAQVPPAELNAVLEATGTFHLESVTTSEPTGIVFGVLTTRNGGFTVDLTVDGTGLVSGLLLKPVVVAATSWAAVDSQVRSAAPRVHLLVAHLSGRACIPLHTISPATPASLGSAFKLYVLDALAHAISAGRVGWDQNLTIADDVKSLPSGELQNDPAGTQITVLRAATNMISISDNTAADMLIHLVGRDAIEAATRSAGMANP
jgi:Beta-lactamase enzyme family/ORF 12 gene product N-terminal